jgi:hypothetical protein
MPTSRFYACLGITKCNVLGCLSYNIFAELRIAAMHASWSSLLHRLSLHLDDLHLTLSPFVVSLVLVRL